MTTTNAKATVDLSVLRDAFIFDLDGTLALMGDRGPFHWDRVGEDKVNEPVRYILNKLPDGIAIQWETCGPGIQSNPMGLKDIDGFLFSAYNIDEKRYLTFEEIRKLSTEIGFPMARLIEWGHCFIPHGVETRGEGVYGNGKQREGVVIRSQHNHDHAPISFKVINLGYEK